MSGVAAGLVGAAAAPPNEEQIELAEKGAAEGGREERDQGSSRASSATEAGGNAVDVHDAEKRFEDLRRQLSRTSSLHRTVTGQKDVEAGEEDDFDLAEYLNNSLAERDAAGFKRKVVGVTGMISLLPETEE